METWESLCGLQGILYHFDNMRVCNVNLSGSGLKEVQCGPLLTVPLTMEIY